MRVESVHCDICMDVIDVSSTGWRGFRLSRARTPMADLCSMGCLESYVARLAAETSV